MSSYKSSQNYTFPFIISFLVASGILFASLYENYLSVCNEKQKNLVSIVKLYVRLIEQIDSNKLDRDRAFKILKSDNQYLSQIAPQILFEWVYTSPKGVHVNTWAQNSGPNQKVYAYDSPDLGSLEKLALIERNGFKSTKDSQNDPVLAAYHYIESLDVILVGKIKVHDIQNNFLSLAQRMLVIFLLFIIAGLISFSLYKRHTRRLEAKHAKQLKHTIDTLNAYKKGMDTHSMLCLTNKKGQILEANKRFLKNTGYSLEEIVGKSFSKFKSGEHPPEFYKNLWDTILSNRVWHGQIKNKRKNGTFFWVETTITPVKQDNIDGFICIQTEITDKKLFEEKLILAKAYAEVASERKSSFLSHMSHEIRTPLSSIIGYIELVEKDNSLNPKTKQYMQTIKTNSQHLSALVGEVLDFSKIEAGQLEIKKSWMSFEGLVKKIVGLFQNKSPHIDLKVDFQTPLPLRILTDPLRFQQILINLLSNAFKFTKKGEIQLTFRLSDPSLDKIKNKLVIEVQDSGIGIDQKYIGNIFKPFAQAASFHQRKTSGTGLGLSLSKELAHLLGGDLILVNTEPGHGSTFRAYIDFGGCSQSNMSWKAPQILSGNTGDDGLRPPRLPVAVPLVSMNILVVEDSEDISELIRINLEEAGANVDVASSAKQALRHLDKKHYDVVVLDIQLPRMSGHQLVQIIHTRSPRLPVLAVTAHSTKTEKEACFKSSFNDFLTKPIDFECLIHTIAKYRNTFPGHIEDGSFDANLPPMFSLLSENPRLQDQLEFFVNTMLVKITDCIKMTEKAEWTDLKSYCHKIKGAFGTYGYPELQSEAHKIEDLCEADLDDCKKQEAINLHIENMKKLAIRSALPFEASESFTVDQI